MTAASKPLMNMFCIIAGILAVVGVVFSVFGLGILPVDGSVLLRWESAIYGAIMIGWGTTLFLLGRLAFRRNDAVLLKSCSLESLCGSLWRYCSRCTLVSSSMLA